MKIAELEEKLSYCFKNQSLLRRALIHQSYLNENPEEKKSNERLEFLGDEILSFIITDYLFRTYSDLSEGDLTNFRSFLVCTETLYQIALKLDLIAYLKMGLGQSQNAVQSKSILADALEAVIGAIYLDGGMEAVRLFIETHFLVDKYLSEQNLGNYKNILQELTQEIWGILPVYRLLLEKGADHNKTFQFGVFCDDKLWGRGSGRNKKEAQQQAACQAFKKIRREVL